MICHFFQTTLFGICMKWVQKPSNQAKESIRLLATQKRQRSQPEWHELTTTSKILRFCQQKELSPATCLHILKLRASVPGETVLWDHRDYRSVPKAERIPRSLQCPPSPVGYWCLNTPPTMLENPTSLVPLAHLLA